MADIPDGVKPCPAHSAHSCDVGVAEVDFATGWSDGERYRDSTWQVIADCGTAGPHADSREDAVTAWNAMPRREGGSDDQ